MEHTAKPDYRSELQRLMNDLHELNILISTIPTAWFVRAQHYVPEFLRPNYAAAVEFQMSVEMGFPMLLKQVKKDLVKIVEDNEPYARNELRAEKIDLENQLPNMRSSDLRFDRVTVKIQEIAELLNGFQLPATQFLPSAPPSPRFDGDVYERPENNGAGPEEPEPLATENESAVSILSSDTEGNATSSKFAAPGPGKPSPTHTKQAQQCVTCSPPENTGRKRPRGWISCYEVWCGKGFVGNHNWKVHANGNRTCKRCGCDHDNNV